MRRIKILTVLTAIAVTTRLLVTSVYGHDQSSNSDPKQPNVLFIAIDDLNDWVGFLDGHPQVKTPHMDRLAKRGVVFANAHCAAPLCCPSRAAIFSGQQPFETGVYTNDDYIRRLQPNLELLPRHFSLHGYKTFGTGKLLHRKYPDLFDESFFPEQRWSPFASGEASYSSAELPSKGTSNPRHVIAARDGRPEYVLPLNGMPSDRRPGDNSGESFDWGPFDLPDSEFGDGQIATWAAERLGQMQSQPFFMAVGFYRPHIPLFAPAKYFNDYPVDSIELPKTIAGDLDDLGRVGKDVAIEAVTAGSHATVLKYDEWSAAVAAYLACVSFVDHQVGQLLNALDDGPHSQNTIVILWSDHGWHLGEKQHWGKWTGWERSTRVPLVIVPAQSTASGFVVGQVCHRPVSLIDLYPTLVEMCGLPNPSQPLSGESLNSLLQSPNAKTDRGVISTFGKDRYSYRDDRYRLIHYEDDSVELYDLRTDPNEWHNLAAIEPGIVDRLRRRLDSEISR